MKSEINKKNNKFNMLMKIESKRVLGQLSNIILISIIFVIFINVFFCILNYKSSKFNAKVALAIEDNSVEIGLLTGNITNNKLKNIIEFENTSLDEGLELLRMNKIVAIINVKKGTSEKLNSCNNTSFDLYVNKDTNILVKFLIEYIESLVEVLNEGQKGAVIHLNLMKTSGCSYSERLSELNNIAIKYISNFMSRSSVFDGIKEYDMYSGSIIKYYYLSAVIILSILLINMYHFNIHDDFKYNQIVRLIFSDIRWYDICIPKAIIGTIYSCIIIIPLIILYLILFDLFSVLILIQNICFILLLNFIINIVVISSGLVFKKSNCLALIISFIFCITSSLIIPTTSMGIVTKTLSKINILSISHSILLNNKLTFTTIILYSLYILIIMFLLKISYRKRIHSYE